MVVFVTLKYAQAGSCVCAKLNAAPVCRMMCPQHGDRDVEKLEAEKQQRRPIAGAGTPVQVPKRGRPRGRRTSTYSTPRTAASPTGRSTSNSARRTTSMAAPARRGRPPKMPDPFEAELEGMMGKIREVLFDSPAFPTADDFESPPLSPMGKPLTQIDFLASSLEFRNIMYRHLLVPASRRIAFDGTDRPAKERGYEAELQPAILLLNKQVYREAIHILYGENTFVDECMGALFSPNGIGALRHRTTGCIRHLAFTVAGSVEVMQNETSNDMYEDVWGLLRKYPCLLRICSITLRRDIIRPVHVTLDQVQLILAQKGDTGDAGSVYSKEKATTRALAKLAFSAAKEKAVVFEFLTEVENQEHDVEIDEDYDELHPAGVYTTHDYELCLSRGAEAEARISGVHKDLYATVLDMLKDEKATKKSARQAEANYQWWVAKGQR